MEFEKTMTRVFYGFLTAGLVDLLNGAIILGMPYAALYINAGKSGTIANMLAAVVYTVICIFLSEKRVFKERRYNMAAGMFVFSLGCLLLILTKNFFVLMVSSFLFGVGNALYFPSLQVWFTEGMEKPQLIKTMGGYSISWVIGFLIGPSIGGFILGSGMDLNKSLNIIFSGSLILCLITGLLLLADIFKQKIKPFSQQDIPPIFRIEVPQKKCEVFLHIMWLATFCACFVSGLIRYIFTEMGKSENISSFIIGNINTAMYLSLILLVIVLKYSAFWLFSIRYLLLIQILALPAVLVFLITRSIPVYFLASVIFGFLLGFTFYSSSFYSLIFKGKSDKYISINEAMVGAGGFLSGLLGYIFAEFITIKYSFLPGILVLVTTIIIELILYGNYIKANKPQNVK